MDYPQELAALYSRTKRQDLKEKVVEHFSKLVYQRAIRLGDRNNFDELTAVGFMGLLQALKNYDPAKGRFTTIATEYVNGYIMHHLRDGGSLVKNPTNVSSDADLYANTVKKAGLSLDEEIDLFKLSLTAGMNIEKLYKCQKAYNNRKSTINFSALDGFGTGIYDDPAQHANKLSETLLTASLDGKPDELGEYSNELDKIAEIMSYHTEGKTSDWIARETGSDVATVRRCIKLCTSELYTV